LLSVIAQKLLDNSVVGDNLENFAFNSVVQTSSFGERIINNPNSGLNNYI
jgi:hypothetical protein